MFGFSTGVWLAKSYVDRMFDFSSNLGTDYVGRWETPLRFRWRVGNIACSLWLAHTKKKHS